MGQRVRKEIPVRLAQLGRRAAQVQVSRGPLVPKVHLAHKETPALPAHKEILEPRV